MCSPIALAGVGAAAGAYGAYSAQSAENQANEYRAQLSERNAALAEQGALNAEARGAREEAAFRTKVKGMKSTQRVGFAASGVTVDSGSALETVADTAAMGEQDALTMRYNASLEAWGKRAEAGNYVGEARLSRMKYRSPLEAGGLSLLGSAGNFAGSMKG